MTRCQELYRIVKNALENHDLSRLERFCHGEAVKLFRLRTYVQFHDSYLPGVPYGLVSESALRPLISVGDPDVVSKAVEKLKPMIKTDRRGRPPRITGEDVKKLLGQVEGRPYLSPPERKAFHSETRMKEVEACCDEFLAMSTVERSALLNDLRRAVDLFGFWSARIDGVNLRSKLDDARKEIDSLRNELLMFLPGSVDPRRDGHSCDRNIHR